MSVMPMHDAGVSDAALGPRRGAVERETPSTSPTTSRLTSQTHEDSLALALQHADEA